MTPDEFQVWAAAFGVSRSVVSLDVRKSFADKAVEDYRKLGSPGAQPLRVLHVDPEGKLAEGPLPQTDTQRKMYDAIVTCFTECQGLVKNSAEESDRYWELAEELLQMLSASNGEPILRKVVD